jgi:serine/threonine protein phosphatase PrpC
VQAFLTPKINQDSFKVIKGFPTNTKMFNWLFAIYDGHGPNGEIMSQFAA